MCTATRTSRVYPGLLLLFLVPCTLIAGTYGKIAGRVVNKATGEPLPSVNIQIVGVNRGAATDVDGYFVILQVSPGLYSVKASMVGFTDQVVTDVRVRVDLTTQVNFQLGESAVAMQEVVIQAERLMINKDETSRMSIISSQTFSDLPVTSFQEIVGLQAGFTT